MTIAVDFDGTIVEHRFPQIGKPRPMAFEVLKALNEEGHKLILWSNREGKRLEEAIEYCRENGVEFYSVNSEFPNESWTGSGVSRKIVADIYIDDKNLGGLPPWDEIYQKLSNKTSDKIKPVPHSHHHHHHRHREDRKWYNKIIPFFIGIHNKSREAKRSFKL